MLASVTSLAQFTLFQPAYVYSVLGQATASYSSLIVIYSLVAVMSVLHLRHRLLSGVSEHK